MCPYIASEDDFSLHLWLPIHEKLADSSAEDLPTLQFPSVIRVGTSVLYHAVSKAKLCSIT